MAKTININEEVHRLAKIKAAENKITLTQWVEFVIMDAIEQKTDADGNG